MIFFSPPQWGAADAEIKVPSGEYTELKRSPFKAWSRSVYSHTCYAYCQGPPKGGRGCLMSPPCLESQGCHLIPLCYLLSCSSA